MKTIEQIDFALLKIEYLNKTILVRQGTQDIIINHVGAQQLIAILQEFVDASIS